MNFKYPYLDEVVSFHGHLCPGLAIGYRATMAALDRLDVRRARDEELLAIVENDSCSVDAAQFLAGTTFGKGNLIFKDWGKQVFTFARRDRSQAVRVALRWGAFNHNNSGDKTGAGEDKPAMDREQKVAYILETPLETLFDLKEAQIELPPKAEILKSLKCGRCGEPVMETKITRKNGMSLCSECAAAK